MALPPPPSSGEKNVKRVLQLEDGTLGGVQSISLRAVRIGMKNGGARSNLFEPENLLPKSKAHCGIDFVRSGAAWVNLRLFVICEILVTPFWEILKKIMKTPKIQGYRVMDSIISLG